MKGGTITVVLLLAAVAWATEDHTGDFDKIDDRLDRLTARLVKLEERIESRVDPARVVRAKSLNAKVTQLEGTGCGTHDFQCGGSDPQCVGLLLVCDGIKDCRNGADEATCQVPLKTGDVFEGHRVFDRCTRRQPEVFNFEITAIQTRTAFNAYARVRANLVMEYDDGVVDGHSSLPLTGLYSFGTHKVVFTPPEDDRLGLSCEFDGANFDRCVGRTKRDSGETCAKFIFTKKH